MTEVQKKFKSDVKKYIDDLKEWLTDYLSVKVKFPSDNEFSLDVIQDEESHYRVRGELDKSGLNIFNIKSDVTMDVFDEMYTFINEWDFNY